jgi:hypothetical protein
VSDSLHIVSQPPPPGVHLVPVVPLVPLVPPELRFSISINRMLPAQKLGMPPEEKRWAKYNSRFKAEEHTAASLLQEIAQGYSFTSVLGGCQGLHCGGWCTKEECKDIPGHCGRPTGYRLNRHFLSAQYIPLDFDTGDERSTFDHLLGQPLIADRGAFLYTTLSHSEASPKCRVVFITDAPFTAPEDYRLAKRALMARFPWGDASVNDPARLFYGTHPHRGQAQYLGSVLPMEVVETLIQQHQTELASQQAHRALPQISHSQVMGITPSERYVNAAIQQEVSWVAGRTEGSGERHRDLLIAAMKLGSLQQSAWLPEDVRANIDPCALLLPAAEANGYVEKYGEADAMRAIGDGVSYATPRPDPNALSPSRPQLRWSGGQWVKAVKA